MYKRGERLKCVVNYPMTGNRKLIKAGKIYYIMFDAEYTGTKYIGDDVTKNFCCVLTNELIGYHFETLLEYRKRVINDIIEEIS